MILTSIQIKDLILANEYTSARIYEDHHKGDLNKLMAFEWIKKSDPKQLIERIEEIEDICSGDFTFAFGYGTKNEQIRNLKRVFVQLRKPEKVEVIEDSTFITTPSDQSIMEIEKKIEARIEAKITARFERDKEKEYVRELESKIKDLESIGGKASLILNELITGFMTPAGSPADPSAQLQGFEEEEDPNELEQSLGVIVKTFGQDNIIKLARKIESGQAENLIPIVINYINS